MNVRPTPERLTAPLLPALVAIVLATVPAGPADAQSTLRGQTRILNQAIGRQVQQALRPLLVVRNSAGAVTGFDLAANSRYLAIASADGGVRVWDLAAGRQIGRIQAGAIRAVAAGAADRTVLTADAAGQVVLWDAGTGQPLLRFSGHGGAVNGLAVSRDGRLLATAGEDGTVRLWDLMSGRPLTTLTGHAGAVNAVAFDPTGRWLASGGGDRSVRRWSVPDGQPADIFAGHDGAVRRLVYASDAVIHSAGDDGTVRLWRPGSADPQRTIRAARSPLTALAVRPDGLIAASADGQAPTVWNDSGRSVAELSGAAGFGTHTAFAPGGDRVFTAGADGRARVWDFRTGSPVAQLIMTRGGWSVVDGAGRFDGSNRGLGDLARQADNETYEMESFAEPYYEPGLLAKLLQASGTFLTASAPSVESGIAPPPVVTIAAPTGTAAGPAQVTVTATDRGAGIESVALYHNGKAVAPARIVSSQDTGPSGQTLRTVVFSIDLVGGTNSLRAVATGSNRIESVPAEAAVAVAVPRSAPRPTLHLVVIGINQYANPALELNYAVADARGLSAWARQGAKPLYGKVELYELYDRKATRDAIKALFAKLESSRPEDTVIVYYAGHGENADGNWYMLPTEFGRDVPFEMASGDGRGLATFRQILDKAVATDGLAADELRDMVLAIGARHVLVMIDSCKSGNLKRSFDAFAEQKRLQTLSQETGIHVLAATAKEQLAVELEHLGHGAFTYVVLDALKGAADRMPANGVVSAREVLNHAVDEVPVYAFRYSNSEQFPTVYSRGTDFELGPVRKR